MSQSWPPGAEAALREARARAEQGVAAVRAGTRGLLLPLLTWPLFFDSIWEIATGDVVGLLAAAGGMGLTLGATWLLRRGRRGDTRRAALLTGAATAVVAG
ncbi:hypothetical protein, partial [Falsiroseomonas oryziterrae]|uniref:hypothetical protein n=1 Tax=Falsiroseomonas oryziterrae TaxID=2911368 RepID=UPI001F362F6F